jgi:2-phosphosulfolactate phosphatase
VRFDWGLDGVVAVATPRSAVVIVDVLSFSTATSILVAKGTAVYPHPWPSADIERFAREVHASWAVRRQTVDDTHPWSLSPPHLLAAPPVERLVLPSPNGSAIATSARADTVIAGCIRNSSAVALWLHERSFGTPAKPAVVIAAGERWPSGGLRPALEDLLGSGAIIAGLAQLNPGCRLSPEAKAASAAWAAHQGSGSLEGALLRCATGVELANAGYPSDVLLAGEHDADTVVPVMSDGAFRR